MPRIVCTAISRCQGFQPKEWRVFETPLHAFKNHRHALAYSDAHRGERVTSFCPLKLMGRRQHEPGSAHAQRMTESDGSSIRIDTFAVVRQSESSGYGEGL